MITLRDWNFADEDRKRELIYVYHLHCDITYEQRQMLEKSLAVVTRFFIMAHDVAQVRNHYSARTIIEVMRHNSMLEDGDKTFKINNMIGTPLARISMEMFPALNGFFETRHPTFRKEN